MLGHAAAFLATELGLSAVQSSCWYLDWPSQCQPYPSAEQLEPVPVKPVEWLSGQVDRFLWTRGRRGPFAEAAQQAAF